MTRFKLVSLASITILGALMLSGCRVHWTYGGGGSWSGGSSSHDRDDHGGWSDNDDWGHGGVSRDGDGPGASRGDLDGSRDHDGGVSRGGDGPGRRRGLLAMDPIASTPAEMLAGDYSLRLSSAEQILALANADTRKSTMKALGLSKKEIKPLMKGELPSNETIDHLARQLNEDPAVIRVILEDFLRSVEQQTVSPRE